MGGRQESGEKRRISAGEPLAAGEFAGRMSRAFGQDEELEPPARIELATY